jgi:putative membrane protein
MSAREAPEARKEVSLVMDWGNSGWGAGDWVAMIVFWGTVVALIVWAVRNNRRPEHGPADRADTLLAERFARGEIDGEEFTRSRELLHTGAAARSHSGR